MSDYYDDEWYEEHDEDDDPEPDEYSRDAYIYKAPNGHIATCDVTGLKWPGQDWGEADFSEAWYKLSEVIPWVSKLAIKWGRSMKPGTTKRFPFWLYEPDEGEEPVCWECGDLLDENGFCLNSNCEENPCYGQNCEDGVL